MKKSILFLNVIFIFASCNKQNKQDQEYEYMRYNKYWIEQTVEPVGRDNQIFYKNYPFGIETVLHKGTDCLILKMDGVNKVGGTIFDSIWKARRAEMDSLIISYKKMDSMNSN
jgi:hypothetical protein